VYEERNNGVRRRRRRREKTDIYYAEGGLKILVSDFMRQKQHKRERDLW
jgi:hypothetical protein